MFWLCQFQQKENQAINPDKPDSSQHLCFECKFCSFCWKTLGSFKVPSAWPYISPQEKQPVAIPNLRFFTFFLLKSSLSLMPKSVFLLLFSLLCLPICSQGQTYSKKEDHLCTLANFLLALASRLAQPMDLWAGGWGKLWNSVVCTRLAGCVNIYTGFMLYVMLQSRGPWYLRLHSWKPAEPGF